MPELYEDSLPPAWGAPITVRGPHLAGGLTPTCVGSTPPLSEQGAQDPTHPHLRGERKMAQLLLTAGRDSPPPAWGSTIVVATDGCDDGTHPHLRGERGHGGWVHRLTPTCVGNT